MHPSILIPFASVSLLSAAIVNCIDVNYVNVNAFYFYFTPILAEIDVKDIFYLLVLKLRLCRRLRKFL